MQKDSKSSSATVRIMRMAAVVKKTGTYPKNVKLGGNIYE